MRSEKSRDNGEYNGYNLYLKDKHNARFDLEPMQELMLNMVYNFTGASSSEKTYEKGHAVNGTLDKAKQHMRKFGITKVTKPLLWAALDALQASNIVKLVRTEQRIPKSQQKWSKPYRVDHYQFTDHGDQLIQLAIRKAKNNGNGNALW